MSLRRARHLFSVLIAIAFIGAATLQALAAVAIPVDAGMVMATPDDATDSAPVPCKGMTRACMVDLGCVLMVGVPAPASPIAVRLAWLPVSYQPPANTDADGNIRAPDLRPPIRLI